MIVAAITLSVIGLILAGAVLFVLLKFVSENKRETKRLKKQLTYCAEEHKDMGVLDVNILDEVYYLN